MKGASLPLRLYSLLVYAFLLAPLVVVIIVSFNADRFVVFPPKSWSLEWYPRTLLNRDFVDSFVYSVQTAALTTLVSLAVAVPAALAIVRNDNRLTRVVRAVALSPLTFPQVIIGLALLEYFLVTLRGDVTLWTLVLGHVVVTVPFGLQIISSALYGFNRSYEEAARTLGANNTQTFFKVTLPVIRPSVITAALFTFILSFDNVGISLFLSVPGSVPLPIRMFQYVETQYDPTIAVVSTVLILFAVLVLLALQRLGTLEQVFKR